MRIHLSISKPKQLIPFNYQQKITGAIHKWLGINHEHDNLSLYSFSQLQFGKLKNKKLDFPNGTKFFISSFSNEFLNRLINGIKQNPEIVYGMSVYDIQIQSNPNFENVDFFKIASPIFIKRKIDNKTKHYLYSESVTADLLTETLKYKMKAAGLEDETAFISFVQNYAKAGTKLIEYNGINNRANWCPVIIQGKPETKTFAWNVGVGNSTGIGFGALI